MSELFKSRIGRVTAPMTVDFLEKSILAPQPDEVVIRIRASALCGSDLHIYKGKHPAVPLPATIGHEFAGDVMTVGSEVKSIAVGDRVTVEPCVTCHVCEACRRGNYGYCEQIAFIYRIGEGAMADYITVKASSVFSLPKHLTYETGALIEPLAVAVHAVRRADVKMGETVLVIGAGAIGLMVAGLCRKIGAREVVVSDYVDSRLEIAEKFGATTTLNPSRSDGPCEYADKMSGNRGFDKSFECVGLEATFREAMFALRKGGTATIVGIFEQPDITVIATRFITHEIKVQGSQGYCWDFPIALQMSQEINLGLLVTHTFPLEELGAALKTAIDRNSGSVKVCLIP